MCALFSDRIERKIVENVSNPLGDTESTDTHTHIPGVDVRDAHKQCSHTIGMLAISPRWCLKIAFVALNQLFAMHKLAIYTVANSPTSHCIWKHSSNENKN